ncbi:MAG: S-layer homology domain-containing protein [Oscillibacter sp.]|nr:S-layer homology domain-containing protein [Oscillibacter sp.]
MKCKRLIASLLLCATLVAMALPVGAAKSSFDDVYDSSTALNADVLRLMGVVSGSGGNHFSPNANLTRAEFCVMAVKVMGRGDEVPIHTTRTIFTDVTARHWARGYINLAASITVDGEKADQAGSRLISGVGTGQFRPDSQITFAQAVTILMRMLGYGDDVVGAVWPAGYMNLASSLHLTQGLSVSPFSPITRAQAAQLFVNLLSTKTENGKEYCTTLGSATENVMLLAVDVTGDDGLPGAIRTSKGTYQPANEGVVPTALQGCRGTLVVNDRNELVTFVPDGSTAITVTLSGDAQATFLKATDGTKYSINATTPAFTSTEDSDSTWADLWVDLRSGSQVTLFLDGGKVIGVYYAAGGMSAAEAYVVTGPLNSASFHQLTGGATNYTIKKDNEPIELHDIQLYDVVTYDPVSNTLVVSDLHLTCVYENAYPNPTTPETITVLGHEFPVLDCAMDSIGQFKLGENVSLLLTADGKVAGMAKPSADARTTATGIAGSSSVLVDLPNGGTIELKGTVPELAQDQVVTVSASKGDKLSASRITSRSIPGDFDIEAMTLGQYKVAAGVKIYEEGSNMTSGNTRVMVPISLADLEMDLITERQISTYHLNRSGMVDIIILNSITGDALTYGLISVDVEYDLDEITGEAINIRHIIALNNRTGTYEFSNMAVYDKEKDGTFAGAALDNANRVRAYADLSSVSGVKRSDFFEKDGVWYVNAKGTVYQVSSKVEGYIKATDTWFTQTESDKRLAAIRAFSDDMTVYVDPIGHKVRVIVVN